jgi:hypothetical protein
VRQRALRHSSALRENRVVRRRRRVPGHVQAPAVVRCDDERRGAAAHDDDDIDKVDDDDAVRHDAVRRQSHPLPSHRAKGSRRRADERRLHVRRPAGVVSARQVRRRRGASDVHRQRRLHDGAVQRVDRVRRRDDERRRHGDGGGDDDDDGSAHGNNGERRRDSVDDDAAEDKRLWQRDARSDGDIVAQCRRERDDCDADERGDDATLLRRQQQHARAGRDLRACVRQAGTCARLQVCVFANRASLFLRRSFFTLFFVTLALATVATTCSVRHRS